MERPLEETVEAASRGDAQAMGALMERHLPALHAFVRLRAGAVIRAKESCADLVQSVCREVLQDLGKFEYRGEGAFKAWLFEAALRKVIDRGRYYAQQKRDAAREAPDHPEMSGEEATVLLRCYASGATPSEEFAAHEETERIEHAFEKLPDRQREVVTLIRIAGLSYAEAAEATGQSLGAVRGLMKRGMARLARLLAEGQDQR